MNRGRVIFVGAGPGDPKLITIKGREALQQADVVVYDRLAHPVLLTFTRPDAQLIYAGKESSKHVMPQEEINRLLVREAQKGQTVVRLKGGDPAIFGRVGEEAQACREAGIPFDVVPGVTSGTAVPMYAGIPLTHRDYDSSVTFLTGHPCEQNTMQGLNWAALAALPSLVIYMGVKNLPFIQKQLLDHGMAPDTPVALVRWGTVSRQQTLVGKLNNIAQQAQAARFQAPAIIVIGEMVRLREELNWHETKPLFGTTVACAIADDPSPAEWTAPLTALGAEVVPVRLISRPLPSPYAEQFVQALDTYHWLVFSDRRQVEFFFQILREHRWDIRRLKAQLAVLGQDAADALENRGLLTSRILPAGLSIDQIRRRLAAPSENICFLQGGFETALVKENDTVLSLGRLIWDNNHPAAPLIKSQPFHAYAAADPYHLSGLAEFIGEKWQSAPLYCFDSLTAQQARKMGWKHIIQWASHWEPAHQDAATPHLPLPEYRPTPALRTQNRQSAGAGN